MDLNDAPKRATLERDEELKKQVFSTMTEVHRYSAGEATFDDAVMAVLMFGEWFRDRPLTRTADEGLPVDHRCPEISRTSLQGAFVSGAKWWEFRSTGGTMWASDRDKTWLEAELRYPAPDGLMNFNPATLDDKLAIIRRLFDARRLFDVDP